MNYEKLAEQAINGDIDALEAYIKLSNAKKELEQLMKSVLDSAIYEFDMHEEKTIIHKGFEIRKTQSARYDYSQVTAWNDRKKELSKIEDYAKLALKNGENLILETGEIIEPAIKKYSDFGLAIKPAKN